MNIKIVSDLHYDYNSYVFDTSVHYGFEDDLQDTDLLLICGDTGSNHEIETNYLNRLKKKLSNTIVACVAGNHLGYEKPLNYIGATPVETMRLELRKQFCDKPIYYLENEYFSLGDYIVAGCTLYTDFSLYGNSDKSGNNAIYSINDFRTVFTINYDEGLIRNVHYTDYIKWHNKSKEFIEQLCNKFQDKKIILLTHFLVTPKSLNVKYTGDITNPYYCTDLEKFISQFDNIKLIACGHSHGSNRSYIGDIPVILEPYGYYDRDHQILPENYFGYDIVLT